MDDYMACLHHFNGYTIFMAYAFFFFMGGNTEKLEAHSRSLTKKQVEMHINKINEHIKNKDCKRLINRMILLKLDMDIDKKRESMIK